MVQRSRRCMAIQPPLLCNGAAVRLQRSRRCKLAKKPFPAFLPFRSVCRCGTATYGTYQIRQKKGTAARLLTAVRNMRVAN
jgi:hypothetical protein